MEQQEGVTQSVVEPQISTQDSSPEPVEASGEVQAPEGSAEHSELQPKSKEYNFRQLRESVNRLETERKQWLAEREQIRAIEDLLTKDPKAGLKQIAQAVGVDLKTLIEAQTNNDLPQINFEQYDPETAKLLKFLHEKAARVGQLEQWKNEFEQRIEQDKRQTQQTTVQQNIKTLENKFTENLMRDGFLDKDGKGDIEVIDLIQGAILAKLAKSGDPRMATLEQCNDAYTQVLKGLSAHKTKTLQNTITRSVPSSGSRNGAATTAKPPMTKEQRIAELANASKQMFGFE